MSTKTNFKRLALGVIAALGFGMLSVAPSQATISTVVVTTENGTADTDASDSTTAATISVSFVSNSSTDSVTIASYVSAKPTLSANLTTLKQITLETTTSTVATQYKFLPTGGAVQPNAIAPRESVTAIVNPGSVLGTVAGSIGLYFDTYTGLVAGTYTITSLVTPFSNGVAGTPQTVTNDIVVSATAAESEVASQATSTLSTITGTGSYLATASATARGTLTVTLKNSSDEQAAQESVTATITGPGTIGVAGGAVGKSVVLPYTAGTPLVLSVYSDGTAGSSTISVRTTSVTFATQTINFYAAAAATITALTNAPVITVGSNSAVILASAVDADGNVWGGTARIYATSAASALIAGSETPGSCTFSQTLQLHVCSVTGKLPGTASFKVIDAATVALATATSNEVSTRVSAGNPGTAVLSFDKATYAPGEKAQVRVQVLDINGLAMPAVPSISAGFSAAITSTKPFGAGSATFQDTITIAAATSATSDTNAGHMTYVVYMPLTSGPVTVSATGGTGLPLAGRVATSATATVVNDDPAIAAATAASEAAQDAAAEAIDAANAATDAANLSAEAADAATVAAEEARDAADAATAAVEALATEVATLMAALKAQITTLANTVAKIAKKVKA